ncbi:YdeI family protein [Paradesertivirga mongoliensis]|uniref:YdeI family protein n=1 Tax=Paradesertivirga mongoliensis TaxID=2100740 RepID=A0ABW4ZHW5_9SPHI|nr:YdeI/OmpD-associated family protein [Pedobacter mongoliensis]
MEKYDPRINAYIEKSADFAKPVLNHIRNLVHQASPEILETVKWGFPHFDSKGTLCSMASFKEHCAFGFWKSALLTDPLKILQKEVSNAMGQFGRIKSIADLPEDAVLISYIREAIVLNEKGIKVSKSTAQTKAVIETPDYFTEVLNHNPIAKAHFENFSNSHRKEYIEWFEEAKTDETRNKRIATAIEWITEGKGKNWKYERTR